MENEEKRWKTMENGSLSRLAFDPPACSPFHSESEGRLGSSPWGLAAKAPIIPSLGSQRSHSGAMAVAFLWLCGENVEKMWSKVSEVNSHAIGHGWAPGPNFATRGSNMAWLAKCHPLFSPLVYHWVSWPMDDFGFRSPTYEAQHFFGVGKLRWKKNAPSFEHEIDSRCLSSNMLSTTDPAPSGNSYLKPSKKTRSPLFGKIFR